MDSKTIYGIVAVVITVTVIIVGLNYAMQPHEGEEPDPTVIEYTLRIVDRGYNSYSVDVDFDSDVKGSYYVKIGDKYVGDWYGILAGYFNPGHFHEAYGFEYENGQTYDYVVENLSLEFQGNIIGKRV